MIIGMFLSGHQLMEKCSQISVADTYQLIPQDHVWGNSPLHSACYHGKLDVVQLLILEQPSLDINVRNHRGDSPLTLACQAGHLDVIHFLLTFINCDITHTNKAGDTPLHVACSEGHTAAVKVLCSSDKYAVDGKNRDGNSPLALACRGGHLDVIKFLIESMHSSISTQNKDGDTPLHIACSYGSFQVVKFLVSISNTHISTKNTEGNIPLHLACQSGWKHIVEFLIIISIHVSVNQQNNDGNTPLHVAISSHQKDIAELLSHHPKCSTEITNKDGNMPLHLACMEGWTHIVQYLLSTGGNVVNAQNIKGNTPLHICCLKGHTVIVKIIISRIYCYIDSKNERGNTPLNFACQEGKLDIVRLLVDKKECDPNLKNKAGVCALHLAFYNRHQSVVEVLIRHDRCDVNCTDAVENTPLGLAANLSWTDVVRFLTTEKQCNMNHQNKFGDTPLHLSKCVSVAELLTECDVNYKNSRGDTALSIACQHNLDFVKFLIEQKHCAVSIQNADGDSLLHHACRYGRLSIIKYIVNEELLPVNCENKTGNTPLCVAAGTADNDVVQFLVEIDDCDVNHQNKKGDTPLHIACRIGDICVVRTLTDFRNGKVSCNFNVENNQQETPALIAFNKHHNDIFRLLVTEHHCECLLSVLERINFVQWSEAVGILIADKNINGEEVTLPSSFFGSELDVISFLAKKKIWNVDNPIKHGNTLLHFLCQYSENPALFIRKHEAVKEVNCCNDAGNTPLHLACLAGNISAVQLLTNITGCKTKIKNDQQETPALIAFRNRHSAIFKLLVTAYSYDNLFSVLESISKNLWPEVVKLLTSDGTITVSPQFESRFDVIHFLFKERVWVLNDMDNHGNTPLHIACLAGDLQVIKTVTSFVNCQDCKVQIRNRNGDSPLHHACRLGKLSIVEYLVNSQLLPVNCENNTGNTPLCVAAGTIYSDVVQFLVEIDDCDVNHQNKKGDTPLHIACRIGYIRVVRALTNLRNRKVSCNFNVMNNQQETPALIAFNEYHNDIFRLLVTEHHCECLLSVLERIKIDQWSEVVGILIADKNANGEEVTVPSFFGCKLQIISFLAEEKIWNVDNPIKHGNTVLHFLCQYSENPASIDIHEAAKEVNYCNNAGNTPLHLACLVGNVSAVQLLTNITGYRANIKNIQQETPALIAFRNRHSAIFRLLVTAHSYDNLFGVLECISKDLWAEVVKLLTSDGAITVSPQFESQFDVIHFLFKERVWNLNDTDDEGNTPLHIACLAGDLNVVRTITSCHCNIQNKHGNTPLCVAAGTAYNDVVHFLVEIGDCDVNHQNKNGDTPLHVACRIGDIRVVRALTNFGNREVRCNFNVENNQQETPALIAFNEHHNDIFRLLVTEHHSACECLLSVLEKLTKDQWSEAVGILIADQNVIIPSFESKLKVISFLANNQAKHDNTFLFEKGVWDLNGIDVHGNTPLHIACLSGDLNTVRIITSFADCNFNIKNKDGSTAAQLAYQKGYYGVVKWLIIIYHMCFIQILESFSHQEGPDIMDLRGHFYLFHFSQLGIQKTWNPNHQDKFGNTLLHYACLPGIIPLHIACLSNNTLLIKFLIDEEGCDVNACNRGGDTPLHTACSIGNMRFLLSVANCNAQIVNGDTPLHIACKAGKSTVMCLINHSKCDVNCQNSSGDTPLHLACRLDAGDIGFSIVQSLLTHEKCMMDIQNHDGDTPLTLACQFASQPIVQQLINSNKCNINHQNKDGNGPLHNACRSRNLVIVKALLTKNCNIVLRNKQGETPALVAFNHQQPDILRLLITEEHCEYLIDLLEMISKEKWPDVVKILIGNKTFRTNVSTFLSALDVVKLLVWNHIWNINSLDESGNSALHHACYYGHTGLVQFLVDDQKLDIMHSNSSGDTPLHTACLQGHSEVVKAMLSAISRMKISCKPDVSNNQGETPLHFACTEGHLQVVKMLLLSGFFDPTACNIAGITPVELASNYRVITELVSWYVGFQSSNPLWSNIKVCVVGNHASGKTTLVQVLQREAKLWMKVFPKKFKKVSNVESCTCGIIPVQLHSKRFGNVILYDFAGHEEYYSSHAAVLKNFRSSSLPPLFIILIKLVESEEEITRQLYYWTSMVESHCKTTKTLPRVIIVGSFADKVKEFLPQKAKHVKKLLGLLVDEPLSNLCSLQVVGFVPLDCRILASQGNDTLCNLLAVNCHSLQEVADTSFGCHVLYALLSDKFTGNVACTVSEILTCIHSDDACEGLLPHDTGNLVHLLKTLSDYGEIVLLLNQERPENSWVVLDKTVLLSEINGTVFAPEHFERRYKGFLMSTGVVPLTKLQDAFPDYDPEMITSFLIHLEFCQEVKDPDALGGITATHLQLTQSTTPSAVTERYFFFPALVNLEKPTDVWEDNEAIHYSCGWLLRCIKPDKFLTFRFIHVLLLRLAFSYALTPESHHYPEDPSYPVLRKRCSVWKNGIQWFSRAGGIETIVEVREQTKRVAILMRCPTKAEIECAKLRSSVIEKVLSIQNEFCPAVTPMAECLIHPNDVQYPLPSTEQLKLFSHKEIAELVIANPEQNEQFAIGEIPSSVTDAQQLLSFEPYLGLGEALVQQLFSDKDADKTVSETFLDKLAERVFQRMPMFKKMLNTSENEFAECHGQAEVRQCCYLFKLWSQQREKATYRSLRKEFDRNSIFHGRNPLVSFHYSLILLIVHNFVDK